MKRNVNKAIFAIIVLLTVWFIAGCSNYKDLGVYDKKVPQDQLCTLEISSLLTVKKFNDKKVGWYLPFGQYSGNDAYSSIKIPAGNHSLSVYFNQSNQYTADNLSITYNFKVGHIYRLSPVLYDKDGNEVHYGGNSIILKIVDKTQ